MIGTLARLATASLWNRRGTALLTLASITLAVTLLLGVEALRTQARDGFRASVSGTDLVVGARTAPVQLLLASVFHIGDVTANLSMDSYETVRKHPLVDWSIPLALGDSHRGFRVVGTDAGFFEHFRHGRDRPLRLARGAVFDDRFDVVLGASVAAELGYGIGDALVLSHGTHAVSFTDHDALPFRVSGVLAPTGTPVDRALYVALPAIEAIHLGWEAGVPMPGRSVDADAARAADLAPTQLSAFLLGLKTPTATFQIQQLVNRLPAEPLLAILPGVAMQSLFALVGVAERALLLVSAFVVLVGLAGMTTMLLASLSERRRELAILRALGAGPRHLFFLVAAEALVLTVLGAALGLVLVQAGLFAFGPLLEARAGIVLAPAWPDARQWMLLAAVVGAGVLVAAVPAWRAYRRSLADGLSMRL